MNYKNPQRYKNGDISRKCLANELNLLKEGGYHENFEEKIGCSIRVKCSIDTILGFGICW